jgi:hypothetical protein
MALPTSGPLSIDQIRNALGSASGSLRTLSSLAGFSPPDSISEFYGYNPMTTVLVDFYMVSYAGCYDYYAFAANCVGTSNNTTITIYIKI